jgi:hypothetical protein
MQADMFKHYAAIHRVKPQPLLQATSILVKRLDILGIGNPQILDIKNPSSKARRYRVNISNTTK